METNIKHYLLSKTFWLSTLGAVIEIGNYFQAIPLSPTALHAISAILFVAVAINRALKSVPVDTTFQG